MCAIALIILVVSVSCAAPIITKGELIGDWRLQTGDPAALREYTFKDGGNCTVSYYEGGVLISDVDFNYKLDSGELTLTDDSGVSTSYETIFDGVKLVLVEDEDIEHTLIKITE